MTTVDFDHEWMTWGRSGGVLSSQGQSAQLDIGVMSFQRRAEVVAAIEGEVARGIFLKQATDQANQSPGVAHRSQVYPLSEGKYVIDDTRGRGSGFCGRHSQERHQRGCRGASESLLSREPSLSMVSPITTVSKLLVHSWCV